MEPQQALDGEAGDPGPTESTDSLLEALLVDDAEVDWDPVSGKPRVARRGKADLDSPAASE